ncbi:MAG TPA: MFS transporter [Opitutaceae bacterium]
MATSAPAQPIVRNERWALWTLAAVQFTHIMDFMIMMPLGSHLMRVFAIGPAQFSWLVSAYGWSAGFMGFLGGFVLDRFDRKRALLALYTGFGIATLACALAPTFHLLVLARIAAGAFGGVAGSVVTAMVGDLIPPERRGRAMATVMSAFPLASILGVPVGLMLAGWWEWHAPFFLLAGLSVVIFAVAWRVLPHVTVHRTDQHPVRQMFAIVTHPVHVRGFLLSTALVFAGGSVIPFMAPSMVANVGVPEERLWLIYLAGGGCTFFSMPWFGRLSDRHDKLRVLAWATLAAAITVLILTNLPASPLPVALVVAGLFFVSMSGRFTPAMALITNAVEARYRGGFMSVNAAVQQAASGLATIISGLLVTRDLATGRLLGYPRVGLVAAACFGLTVVLAAWLRALVPHAARPAPARAALVLEEPAAK